MPESVSETDANSDRRRHARPAAVGPGLALAIAVGTGLMLRAGMGYRSLPSTDDFNYIPQARACLDPELFTRDTVIQQTVSHVPLWPALIRSLEGTVGMSLGLWSLTILLSVVTVVGMLRLIRSLGGSGILLPFAALLGLVGNMHGLGRGTFDGAFGNAFHMQWVALTLLLFVYDATLRQRYVTSGVLLGLAAVCHPVVASHGALAVACSAPFWGHRRWRNLLKVAGIAFLASSPITIAIVSGVLAESPGDGASTWQIANLCYLFRLPHEYLLPHCDVLLYLVYVTMGLAGLAALAEQPAETSERNASGTMAGLFVGHVVLVTASVLMHDEVFGSIWTLDSLLPFQLHFTRTTPLLLVLSAVAVTTALEREAFQVQQATPPQLRWGRLAFWCVMIGIATLLLLAGTAWSPMIVALAALGLLTLAARPKIRRSRSLTALWCLAAGIALVWHGQTSTLEVPRTAEEVELHDWVKQETPVDSLFVVPPGMRSFRYYALRSIYVDFKYFPTGVPAVLPEWRRRLERAAAPDALALAATGWTSLPEWDRTYANRNTPRRIAELLAETGADYLVWDRQGLELAPHVPVDRTADPRVAVRFENDRFCVYGPKQADNPAQFDSTPNSHEAHKLSPKPPREVEP